MTNEENRCEGRFERGAKALATIDGHAGQKVVDALEGVGQSEDRPFHPHITLARVRSPRNGEALARLIRDNAKQDFGSTRIVALKLKSSELTPGGPIYRDVREYALH